MTSAEQPDPRVRELAEAATRLVRDGIADGPTAVEHVVNENAGRNLGRIINAQRGQQEPKKP